MARQTRQQRRAAARPAAAGPGAPRAAARPAEPEQRRPERREETAVAARHPRHPLPPGVGRRAEEGRMARPARGRERHRGRSHRLRDRGRIPLGERRGLEVRGAARAAPIGEDEDEMFRWYVINTYSGHENKVKTNLEHRIESMNQRAALPARRRPDRAGDRDEGRPEGADREARPPGLRAREHGPQRRRLDGREEHAGRDRVRRRRREARAALPARGRPHPAHGRRRPPRRRAPRWSSSSASR